MNDKLESKCLKKAPALLGQPIIVWENWSFENENFRLSRLIYILIRYLILTMELYDKLVTAYQA